MFGVMMIKALATFNYCRKKKGKQLRKILRVSALFVIWLTVTGGIFLADSPANGEISQPVKVIVDSGDTLWGLAKIHAPRGMDVRHYLAEVLEENKLASVLIYPGQEIILP
jgi:hypothetical protein